MAGKVDVKFVAILGVCLLLLAGGVGFLALKVVSKSGEDHERIGDALLAKGDIEGAAEEYSKAVAEDRTNVRWLKKWRDVLIQQTPASEAAYRDAYQKNYMGILQQLAAVQATDAAAQEEYLGALYYQARVFGASGQAWGELYSIASRALDGLPQGAPETDRLRRYTGLAKLYEARSVEPSEQTNRQILDDLTAAVAADPTDMESQLGLVELMTAGAGRAKNAGRVEDYQAGWANAKARLRDLIATYPDDARPRMRLWEMEADEKLDGGMTLAQRTAAITEAGQGLDPVVDAVTKMDIADLDRVFLARLQRNLLTARKEDGADLWLAIIQRRSAEEPNNPTLLLLQAEALGQAGRHDEAIAEYQKILDMPDLPVSLEGMVLRSQRVPAAAAQVEQALQRWSKTPPEDQPAAMEMVKSYRDKLAERVSEDNILLLRVDSLIAVNERRNGDAVRLLSDLNTRTGASDVGVLLMLAGALERDGSVGAAIQQYDRVLALDPTNYEAQLQATELEMRLQNIIKAYDRIKALNAVDPDNPRIKQWYEVIRTVMEDRQSEEVTDPMVRALLEARRFRLMNPADFNQSARILDKLIEENPQDPRPLVERVLLYTQQEQIEEAKKLVKIGRERFPNHDEIRLAELQLTDPDPVSVRIRYIEESNLPPMDKLLQVFYLQRTNGMSEKAAATLAQAEKLDPNDQRIVEIKFVDALEAKNYDEARAQAAVAATRNIDQLGGELYKARLELAEQKYDAAITTLERATSRMPYSAPAWRLLGQARISKGQVDTGLEALRRANEIRPTDPSMVRPLIGALVELRRSTEALLQARRAKSLNPNEPSLISAWLDLEEQFGDKNAALDTRKRRYTIDPGDVENTTALARLMIGLNDYAGAREALSMLPVNGPEALVPVSLRARLAGATDGPEAGARLWDDYIASLTENPARLTALLGKADYYSQLGDRQQMMATLEAARAVQSKELMEADRRIGDILFSMGDNEQAAAVYQRVIDGNADVDLLVAKRRVEALLRQGKWDDAVAGVDLIEKKQGRDLQTILLRVDAAAGKGDNVAARRLVDEAVTLAPTDPQPFIRRAQLAFSDPLQSQAVIRDLDQAKALRPTMAMPRKMLADLYAREGRVSESVAQLNEVIKFNPLNDQLRLDMIMDMIQLGRVDDAKTAARLAIEQRSQDEPQWFVWAGDVMARTEDFRQAASFYERGYAATQRPDVLGRWVDSLLRLNPPQVDAAERALNTLTADLQRENRMMVEAFRARIDQLKGRSNEALSRLASIYEEASGRPDTARAWVGQVDLVLGGDPIKIAQYIESVQPASEMAPHMKVLLARHMSQNPQRWAEALALLSALDSQVQEQGDVLTILDLHRSRAGLYYVTGEYAKSAEEYKQALKLSPNDAEFNNNLAFTLAKHLNKADEAVPYAERAAAREPENPAILDTLGVLYTETGQTAKAEQTLDRALQVSVSPSDRAAALVHLARVKVKLNDRLRARSLADEAATLIATDTVLQQTYGGELESLMQELRRAE